MISFLFFSCEHWDREEDLNRFLGVLCVVRFVAYKMVVERSGAQSSELDGSGSVAGGWPRHDDVRGESLTIRRRSGHE